MDMRQHTWPRKLTLKIPRRVQNTIQRCAYLRAAEKQLTAEKQPIVEKLRMAEAKHPAFW